MLSLNEFLETHGRAANRIARGDNEVFNECLVIPFEKYVKDFDGRGDPKAYVLMKMRYAVLKYLYRRDKFESRFGAPLEVDPVATETEIAVDETKVALRKALDDLPQDQRQVLELWSNGYTHAQISAELAECIRSVRRKLRAGLIQVSRELGNEISFD